MKVVRKLKMSPDEFFNLLEENYIASSERDPNRLEPLRHDQIKAGLSLTEYSKKGEETGTVMKLKVYDRGKHALVRSKTPEGTITLDYQLEEIPEGIEVTFEQIFPNEAELHKKGFFAVWSGSIYLSRMCSVLYDMELEAMRRRGEAAPKPNYTPVAKQIWQSWQEKQLAKKKAQYAAEHPEEYVPDSDGTDQYYI